MNPANSLKIITIEQQLKKRTMQNNSHKNNHKKCIFCLFATKLCSLQRRVYQQFDWIHMLEVNATYCYNNIKILDLDNIAHHNTRYNIVISCKRKNLFSIHSVPPPPAHSLKQFICLWNFIFLLKMHRALFSWLK